MPSSNISVRAIFAIVAFLCVATAPYCQAARSLKQRDAYNSARVIRPAGSTPTASRSAQTTKEAETSANAAFNGVHRLVAPSSRRSYATADANGMDINSSNRVIAPRARSAQDNPGGPNRGNGASSMPALVIGGIAMAQTYEGATSVATTDSLALNRGAGTAISNSRITTRTGTLKAAGTGGSYGVTSQGVGSSALSGAANGHIALAQADQAVAMAQVERASP